MDVVLVVEDPLSVQEIGRNSQKFPAHEFLSTPVPMHGGLLCIAFCLSVRLSVWCHLTKTLSLDQNL